MPADAVRSLLAAILIVALPVIAHAAGQATVRGAERLNVREAPDLNSPAFLSLAKGTPVTVEALVGDWALVRLESGRRGYVRAVYLSLPEGIPRRSGSAATPGIGAAATPAVVGTATITALPTAATTSAPGADALHSEVAELRQRLAALESAVVATPPAGSPSRRGEQGAGAPTPAVREAEPTRASVLVPTVGQLSDSQELGPSLAMAGVGLVIGFLIGAAYGQRQERNRRTRVRF